MAGMTPGDPFWFGLRPDGLASLLENAYKVVRMVKLAGIACSSSLMMVGATVTLAVR